jgi:hypothetical protein
MTPFEYTILDSILYRYHFKSANDGKGWAFHVRTLATECNVAIGTVSQILNTFPFIEKRGRTRNMMITFDEKAFTRWILGKAENKKRLNGRFVQVVNNDCSQDEQIVHGMNNDCSRGEPRSKSTEVVSRNNNIEYSIQAQQAGILKGDFPPTDSSRRLSECGEAQKTEAVSSFQPGAVAPSAAVSLFQDPALAVSEPAELKESQLGAVAVPRLGAIDGFAHQRPVEDDGSAAREAARFFCVREKPLSWQERDALVKTQNRNLRQAEIQKHNERVAQIEEERKAQQDNCLAEFNRVFGF